MGIRWGFDRLHDALETILATSAIDTITDGHHGRFGFDF